LNMWDLFLFSRLRKFVYKQDNFYLKILIIGIKILIIASLIGTRLFQSKLNYLVEIYSAAKNEMNIIGNEK